MPAAGTLIGPLMKEITLESDPVWTDRYEAERERILSVAGDELLGVFHVGSTAIPDLPGKPVLDVMPIFTEYESMRAVAASLADDGYELETDAPDCVVSIREESDHVVAIRMHTRDADQWRPMLVFREYLRENAAARREYERVKREAAAEHREDLDAYTRAKTDVVRSLVAEARDAGYDDRLPEFA